MNRKATHVYAGFDNPDTAPFTLSPLAIEDLTGEPAFTLTANGRAEVAAEDLPTLPMTPLLVKRLQEFREAREAREKASKSDLGRAIAAEDVAALNVAWALENLVNQERA